MPGAKLGENCNIGQNVFIGNVSIGSNVKIQNNVSIYDGVELEDDVFCGPSCVFTNVINPRSSVVRKNEYKRTIIKKGSSIGANATIVCGVTLGEYTFVGAGTVVNKSTKRYSLVVGNPLRQIGWMTRSGEKINFDNNKFFSELEKKYYYFKDNEVLREDELF
jgi:UDP-2-acetamido-3-amino-2,3-dideoxy-glucuronate N-acetyltransferase